ncbi:MAG: amidohydrolase family protein [Alphaproteobacteria bacterium]|nr:amidohydrolase family protein [Alphaproteobacteria bacterium]
MTYDLKIKGGLIVDGTGAPAFAGDVGVRDGRIVALGDAPDAAARTVAADGLVVAPGFVDIHTHYDAQVLWDPMMTISPWHGVTSVVVGSCGFGVAPTRPEHRGLILRILERVEAMSLAALEAGLGPQWPFVTFPEYLDAIERRGTGINIGVMAGHTPIRLHVMGEAAVERAATPTEIAAMRTLLDGAMAAGALGFATSASPLHVGHAGKPVPSRLADDAEMIAMARALAACGRGVFHYNGSREPSFAMHETLHRESGRPVVWTPLLSGQLGAGGHRKSLLRAAEDRRRGLEIVPQVACRPIVSEWNFASPVLLDTWSLFAPTRAAPDEAAMCRIYADPAFRAAFRDEMAGRGGRDADFAGGAAEGESRRRSLALTEIAYCPEQPALEGRGLWAVAAERGVPPTDLALDLALASGLRARFRTPIVNYDEAEVEELITDPHVVLGLGDGGAHMSQLCDACYATHLLGHWVREKRALSLEHAIHMITGRTAALYGIEDRGRLAPGLPADIVVFDRDRVAAGPLERIHDLPGGADRLVSQPRGVHAVVCNGAVLPPPGEGWSAERKLPGRLLRGGRATPRG